MGNACFSNTTNCITKHINICFDKNNSNINVEKIIHNDDKQSSKVEKLRNYFLLSEKEITDDLYQKNIKITAKKKRNSGLINLVLIDNSKYETMMKKLLEQKLIEAKGPKRRETIRNGDRINILVKELMNEVNTSKTNKLNRVQSKGAQSIIIKNKDRAKIRQAITVNRKDSPKNKRNLNKLFKSNMKKVNTLNEILTDGNRSTVFNKKETNKI